MAIDIPSIFWCAHSYKKTKRNFRCNNLCWFFDSQQLRTHHSQRVLNPITKICGFYIGSINRKSCTISGIWRCHIQGRRTKLATSTHFNGVRLSFQAARCGFEVVQTVRFVCRIPRMASSTPFSRISAPYLSWLFAGTGTIHTNRNTSHNLRLSRRLE